MRLFQAVFSFAYPFIIAAILIASGILHSQMPRQPRTIDHGMLTDIVFMDLVEVP